MKYPTNPSHPIPRRSLAPLTGAKVKSRETYRVIHREAHVSRLRMSLDFVCYARLSTWTRAYITYKLVRHMESTVERHMESTVEWHMSIDSVCHSTLYAMLVSRHGPEHTYKLERHTEPIVKRDRAMSLESVTVSTPYGVS